MFSTDGYPFFLSFMQYPSTQGFQVWVLLKFFIFQDMNNFESDPEEFARTFCKDLGIEDPEVGVSKADNCSINLFSLYMFLFVCS